MGDLTITWSDCSTAVADYTIEGVVESQNLTRLSTVFGLECGSEAGPGSPHSGSWYDPTHNGEGLVIEILNEEQVLMFWFSYGPDGTPAWFFGVGMVDGSSLLVDELFITSGGIFGAGFDPDAVEFEVWGSASVELGCTYGTLDYDSHSDGYGAGKQTLFRLTGLGDFECEESHPPNILLVIADDLGKDASNAYGIAAEKPATPMLDQLAADGLVFDRAWIYPTCSPTRAAILTGKYGYQTGVLTASDVLSTDETSLQQTIDAHLPGRYSNAVIGKWHLGPGNNPDHPTDMGVAHFAGVMTGGVPDYQDWTLTQNGQQNREQTYTTSKFADLAVDWIDDQQQPWFLWLAFNAPHTPFHLPPADLHSQDLSGTTSDIESNPLPYYLAAIEAMDTELARVLDSMDEETRQNTTIIFIGDNGTPGQVAQSPYSRRKAKGSLNQGGINVPFFVSGAGVLRGGERENAMVEATDLFTTIAALAGVNVSAQNDSLSFAGLLVETGSGNRSVHYSERVTEDVDEWAISDGEYKLISSVSDGNRLFHLDSDPYENDDLVISASEPDGVVARLESMAGLIRQ